MNAQKTPPAQPQKTAATAPSSASTAASSTGRKAWVKKTPVDVVLEQIGKQEQKVAEMRKELAREERELAKLTQARKVLEGE